MDNKEFGHYTLQAGMMGIISSEKIWATNIKFLNDEQECKHALDLIKEIVPTSKITSDHKYHAVHSQYISALENDLDLVDDYLTQHVFTFSFSQETDLLSQWRGYCPDNNGFCLVFNIEEVFKQIKSEFDKQKKYEFDDLYLIECVYTKEDKEKIIKDVLNEYWSRYLSASDETDKKSIIEQLLMEIRLLASYFKHPSFSEEKEKRIIVILNYAADSDLKFREGRFSLIPYIELPISRGSINKICIGPTLNKELSKRALETFLEKTYGSPHKYPEVIYSGTPYRPL
jgi:hypothetical protein